VVALAVLGIAAIVPKGNVDAVGTTDYRVSLAKHLTDSGVVMYGAYWCPHCADQKTMFGDAFRHVNYVECDPRGANAKPAVCDAKGVRRYPTWHIGGRAYEGVYTLDELAQISGYQGP
jgi:hypothetical protein